MAGGGRQIAASAMDPAERDLDTGKRGRVGQRRSGLQLGDRGRVLTEPSEQLADPRMELARVRPAERDRRLEMIDRLPIGEDSLGSIRCIAERLGSRAGSTGFTFVDGDERIPRQVVATRVGQIEPKGVRRPGVEQPATGEAGRVVYGVAQATVAEVVARRADGLVRHLADQTPSDQLLERLHGLLVRRPLA